MPVIQPINPSIVKTVPTSPPTYFSGFLIQNSLLTIPQDALSGASPDTTKKTKREGWADLNLRQDFADSAWMKLHITTAGLRAPYWKEPASATRLRSMLHKAGIDGTTTKEAIGTTLGGYLTLNPLLPLWAALALVLEATGQFTPETV